MGYFDEDNNTEETSESSGVEALLESDEDKAARKAREKEEKVREKELRKIEKLEKKRQKRKEKGLFVEDIQDKQQKISDKISGKQTDTVEAAEDTVSETTEAVKAAEKKASEATETVSAAATDITNASENSGSSESEVPESEVPESEVDSDSDSDSDSESEEPKKKKKVSRRKAKKAGEKVDPKDVNIVRDLLSLLIYIGIVVLICFLITQFVGRRTSVHGSSMEPTLSNDDSLWINLLSYKFGDPERYDIIVFPYADDVHYIKRIIGLPGETVQIASNGDILINGQLLDEPVKFSRIVNPGKASTPITLGEDEYFVLGDNRNNSRDSRYSDVGNIKREKILGKAVFRLTPFKKFGSIYN